jgi:hypothetical protein
MSPAGRLHYISSGLGHFYASSATQARVDRVLSRRQICILKEGSDYFEAMLSIREMSRDTSRGCFRPPPSSEGWHEGGETRS